MPKKTLRPETTHPYILQKLSLWGRCIRLSRVRQKITAANLCARLDVSDATLRRMEQGDPRVNAAAYLSALNALGILDRIVPDPDPIFWSGDPTSRARQPGDEDDDF